MALDWSICGFIGLWGLLSGLPQLVLHNVFGTTSVTFFTIASVYGLSWQSVVLMALLLLYGVSQVILMPLLLHFLVRRYAAADGEINLPALPANQEAVLFTRKFLPKQNRPRLPRRVKWISAGAIAVVVIMFCYGALRIFWSAPGLHPPILVGHRGSVYGVENTLEAIQGAIDAGADYAEIDILLSADGVPMVIHDTNLKRLSGDDRNVYDLTAEDLQQLTLRQNDHTGTISTLDEVVRFCQGQIGLVVEFKLHGHEQENVVENSMTILQQHGFVKQCLFMSLDYTLVEEVITRYPEAVIGYCVYGNVGDLKSDALYAMDIDFVVIEEAMVNHTTLYDFRVAGLPVYVWTVNNPANMQRYLELGVIGLYTDYPDVGKQVIEEYNQSANAFYMEDTAWVESAGTEG